jgi:hypothetical protein
MHLRFYPEGQDKGDHRSQVVKKVRLNLGFNILANALCKSCTTSRASLYLSSMHTEKKDAKNLLLASLRHVPSTLLMNRRFCP